MNKKLYVGNLSYETTEDELQKLFIEVGPVVSATIITDRASGRSKGFGFVEMETEQAAQEAIERLNNHEINQRGITVSEARPPKEKSFGGGARRSGRDGRRDRSSRGGDRRRY
jgi:cold-inducible RNA-binding protein